jgi:hypothetical protein
VWFKALSRSPPLPEADDDRHARREAQRRSGGGREIESWEARLEQASGGRSVNAINVTYCVIYVTVIGAVPALSGLTVDLLHAVRLVGRQPHFAAAAILLLAAGVGAAAAVFALVNAVLSVSVRCPSNGLCSTGPERGDGDDANQL